MRLKTFTAPDMNRAMLMIRETMGDDAVIISTTRDSSGKSVSVTAALDEEELMVAAQPWEDEAQEELPLPLPPTASAHKPFPAASLVTPDLLRNHRQQAFLMNELEKVLQYHGVPPQLRDTFLRASRHLEVSAPASHEAAVEEMVEGLLAALFRFEPLHLAQRPERLMVVGPHGVGKTAVVAKLAADLVADGKKVHVLTIDNRRAGGVEQLRAFTTIMGRELEVADTRQELRALLKAIPSHEPVLIDSFGINPYAYEELKELNSYSGLHEISPVLVMAAGGDADEAAEMARALKFLGAKRLVMTRCDAARRVGAALAAADAADLAFSSLTNSSGVAGGLQAASAQALSRFMMNPLQQDA